MSSIRSKYLRYFYLPFTFVLIIITFLIISVLAKSTIIEIDVFAKRVSFETSVHSDSDEPVRLLESTIWPTHLSIKKFQPVIVHIDSIYGSNKIRQFVNPLTISPDPLDGEITFISSPAKIALRKICSSVGSRFDIHFEKQNLTCEIISKTDPTFLTISLQDQISLSINSCTIVDGAGKDVTFMFNDTVCVKLHKLYRSLNILGANGNLTFFIKNITRITEKPIQFLLKQPIKELDFSKQNYKSIQGNKQSTIDSISIIRNFPLESKKFISRERGDIEIEPVPNRVMLFNLSLNKNGLRALAGSKFTSLVINRGAIPTQLVPGLLAVITHHPSTILVITWLGWILSIFIPLFSKIKKKFYKEKKK